MAERATDQFLTARVAPPSGPKTPYVHQSFPTWRYHREMGGRIIKAQEELDQLDEGWQADPFPPPEPAAPAGKETGNIAAWSSMVDRLKAENEKLAGENMRLQSLVQDSSDVGKIAQLEGDLQIAKRALKAAQQKIELMERGKRMARAEKLAPAPEAVPAVPEEEFDPADEKPSEEFLAMLRAGPQPEDREPVAAVAE